MTNFTIYTAIIGWNNDMPEHTTDITTIKMNPTPVEALLRPTQELYNAYKLFSLRQQLNRKDISDGQRNDMLRLIERLPKQTTPMSLYEFASAYTALIRDRVGENLELFRSIFTQQAIILGCTCKPGIKHFCHKFVVQEILDTSARKFGLRVVYGGELDSLGQRYVPDRHAEDKKRRPFYGVEQDNDPNYFDDGEGDGNQPSLDRSASGEIR